MCVVLMYCIDNVTEDNGTGIYVYNEQYGGEMTNTL